MEAKRVADLTVEELQAIILDTKPVSELTVGELKAIIAEVVDRRLINWLNTANQKSYIVLPARTEEEQTQGNLVEGESFQKWLEELMASLRIGLVDFSQEILEKAPIKSSAVLPARTKEEQMQRNLAAIEWLRKWREEGDPEEQTETFEYLQKVLDEDRLSSNRAIFGQQK